VGDPNLEKRRKEDTGLPPWLKLAITVIATTMVVVGWAESRFVSRVEWANHDKQQITDMARMTEVQRSYALAEKVTGDGLQSLTVDVAEIKSDVSWLRSYLDVSQPPPRRNGKKP
jgi:hypothetical protein